MFGGITMWLLRPQIEGELIATTADENAQYGILLAAYEDWVFYADPTMGGALCALNIIDKNSEPIAVADIPVANLNIVGDTLYFTDLERSYMSKSEADGSVVNRAFPVEIQNLTGYLDVGTRSDTLHLGGNLYRVDGLKSFCEGGGKGQLSIAAISESGSYHYNVRVTGDVIKSVERIVTQTVSPLSGFISTSTMTSRQDTVIKLSNVSYISSSTTPQVIPLGVLPQSLDKPTEASLYNKLMDGLGLVYSKVENTFSTETKIEVNESQEIYYRKLRTELEREEGHQIGNVTQIGDIIYYDTYLQEGEDNERTPSFLQIKNTFTGDLVSFSHAADMKQREIRFSLRIILPDCLWFLTEEAAVKSRRSAAPQSATM